MLYIITYQDEQALNHYNQGVVCEEELAKAIKQLQDDGRRIVSVKIHYETRR
jgi:hypothetical protein